MTKGFAAILLVSGLLVAGDAAAQSLEGGRKTFEQRCSRCHGADGWGGEMGPPIVLRLAAIPDPDLAKLIHDGRLLRGMPGNVMPAPEMAGLQKFLRAIQQDAPPVVRRAIQTTDGRTLEGELLGEGASDLQLRTADKRVQLLRREGDRFRPVTSETDWPIYNGDPGTPVFVNLDEGLLVSQSTELRASQRRTYTTAVDNRVDKQLSLIRVPASRSITLTAREGEIPVTVLNETGYPVHVQVRLSSDQLRFPGGTRAAVQSVDLTHRNTTARFRVQARTSGSFPIRIELVSPDGQLTVGTSRVVVRSTAASGVGIVLSVSAALFLLVWWARHAMRARRHRPRQPITVGAS